MVNWALTENLRLDVNQELVRPSTALLQRTTFAHEAIIHNNPNALRLLMSDTIAHKARVQQLADSIVFPEFGERPHDLLSLAIYTQHLACVEVVLERKLALRGEAHLVVAQLQTLYEILNESTEISPCLSGGHVRQFATIAEFVVTAVEAGTESPFCQMLRLYDELGPFSDQNRDNYVERMADICYDAKQSSVMLRMGSAVGDCIRQPGQDIEQMVQQRLAGHFPAPRGPSQVSPQPPA